MSTLLLTLQRAGLLTADAIANATRHAGEQRVSPAEAVVRLGLLDEPRLAGFLHSQLMIPWVDAELLARLDGDTVAQLPAELAWEHTMLPISLDDANNLTVALADPTDLRAVQAAAAHSGAYLIRAVAPLSALREAIYRYHGPRPAARTAPSTPRELPRTEGTPAGGMVLALSSLAYQQLLTRLHTAGDRDAILDQLVEFLAAGFRHVIVFVHLQHQLRGRDARGPELLREAVTQVRIPTQPTSIFADAIRSGVPYYSPWPCERAINRAFADAMGGIEGNALVLPIRLRDKVPVVLLAIDPAVDVEIDRITRASEGASGALERLIYRRKSRETPSPGE
ncbi:MAG: hypothetical protein IPN32_25395 [Deltaproteobacteria bacterium]|nr:hypothetical protein [Deltaproteobacteria bacterium]